MTLYLHGVLRTDYDEMLNSMYWFWSAGLHLAMLGVPVLAAPDAPGLEPVAPEQAVVAARMAVRPMTPARVGRFMTTSVALRSMRKPAVGTHGGRSSRAR